METANNSLEQLINASSLLVSSLDLSEILPRAMETIKELLDCEAASIMLLDHEQKHLCFEVALGEKGDMIKQCTLPLGQGIAGEVALTGKPLIVNDVSQHAQFEESFDKKSGFITRSILCVPLKIKERIIGIAEAINPRTEKTFKDEDTYLLALFANQVGMAIESARLHQRIVTQKKLEDEVNFARSVQESFLPQDFPVREGFSLYGATHPARNVGGDFFDVFELEGDRIGFTVGDVSGKGMGAALFMARALSKIRFLAQKHSASNDPALVVNELNHALLERHSGNMFVTLVYGVFEPSTGEVKLATAAAPHPLLYRAETKTWETIPVNSGLPVGVVLTTHYTSSTLTLEKNDVFLLITDGIAETENPAGEPFTQKRLPTIIPDGSAQHLSERIVEEVKSFRGPASPLDDVTLLTITYP